MKHDPHLANSLIIRSLEAKIDKLEARILRLEGGYVRRRSARPQRGLTRTEAAFVAPILDRAAKMSGCTVAEICGARGSVRACRARFEAAHEMQRGGLSSVVIGIALGGRDHTSVLHMVKRHKERLGIE
jgi:chromosomal replication initiation ATPase DnaA